MPDGSRGASNVCAPVNAPNVPKPSKKRRLDKTLRSWEELTIGEVPMFESLDSADCT